MTNFYLAMFNFKIKINNGEYLDLNKIPVTEEYRKNKKSKYITFSDICSEIFKEGEFSSEDLKVCEIKPEEDKAFYHAKLGLAEYGNKRGLHDGKNDVEKTPLETTDKVLEPFFFMFCTPNDCNETGFLVIEKKKSKPIINEFKKMINNKLREMNDELRVRFAAHTPNELEDIVNDGVVSEYIFTIYENEANHFDEKNLSTIKLVMPAFKRIHPNQVNKKDVLSRLKNYISDYNSDNKFKIKVHHSDSQEATLDIDDIFNPNAFYLKINEEISTVKDKFNLLL